MPAGVPHENGTNVYDDVGFLSQSRATAQRSEGIYDAGRYLEPADTFNISFRSTPKERKALNQNVKGFETNENIYDFAMEVLPSGTGEPVIYDVLEGPDPNEQYPTNLSQEGKEGKEDVSQHVYDEITKVGPGNDDGGVYQPLRLNDVYEPLRLSGVPSSGSMMFEFGHEYGEIEV